MNDKFLRVKEKLQRELGQTITQLLTEKDVVEIMLNPDGKLWVERLGQEMQPVGEMVASQAESLMATVASTINTTITSEKPILECELPIDGSRFEALIPPIVSAPTFTIRKKAYKIFTLDDYVNDGIMSSYQREMIITSVKSRKNILVVGGTGTGKTTLTNAIIEAISTYTPDHRLAIIEDTGEIQCSSKNVVIMRSTEHVSMLRLLKATMRLRPDRILVGEVRGEEALALLKAWNTGHPGGVATVHANDARAGLIRMEQLISEATPAPQQQLIAEAVDVVICIVKSEGGRKVKEIISVDGYRNNDYQLTTIN
ncbi:P-type conjugative transfer ATPase TrbB [Alkanindiges illinoisensis]|uniref:P-type conjugative transfer ATPase TrbB n=1 Tax=Alkanindiges illinoisensis TaxID=197183 RepID=UPI0006853EDA|nr:P-type conjugative transfer ATPase TrbB [Alkanindiges illinoisensis]